MFPSRSALIIKYESWGILTDSHTYKEAQNSFLATKPISNTRQRSPHPVQHANFNRISGRRLKWDARLVFLANGFSFPRSFTPKLTNRWLATTWSSILDIVLLREGSMQRIAHERVHWELIPPQTMHWLLPLWCTCESIMELDEERRIIIDIRAYD